MDTGRQERGKAMAATMKLRQYKEGLWIVPSAAGKGSYVVDTDGKNCTCPDFEKHNAKCKHIYAVEFTISREIKPDGTLTETRTVRLTYSQDWPAYNAAQQNEQERVQVLLKALCSGIVQPKQEGRGRPMLPLADVVFGAVMKVYGTMSGRRSATDIREAQANGHIDVAPHYNSIFRYLEDPGLTPLLKTLVEESAAPLKAVESSFAVDSTGFSTSVYLRWFDQKYGRVRSEREWIKAHVMTGVKTNVVTSVEVTDEKTGGDAPKLPALLESTTKTFRVKEVSADKAYSSNANVNAIVKAGSMPYIPFKSGTTGEGSGLWSSLWHFYNFHRDAFKARYHQRSNVESTFSMIKRKFGGAVRSKGFAAQVNEVLCKVIAHNLCCLVSSIYELGLEPTFWREGVTSS